ncbi:retrovirus-related pol polyprotein LINE-1 [Tanacetum coccineum]
MIEEKDANEEVDVEVRKDDKKDENEEVDVEVRKDDKEGEDKRKEETKSEAMEVDGEENATEEKEDKVTEAADLKEREEEDKAEEIKEVVSKKRAAKKSGEEKGNGKKVTEAKKGNEKNVEPKTPVVRTIDRPVRARKSVERLVEVIEDIEKEFRIEKGRGTTLKDIPNAFLDLEKAYDSVPRELVWKTLLDKGTPRRYSRVIKDMYEGAKTRVRTTVGNTEYFSVEVGLHHGSAISPYIFTLILDELSRGIQENIPWCMIFADDIVLIAESAEGLNNRLESWRKALEDNGLRVSREKTEYLRCDFGRYEVVHQEMDIHIGDQILQPKESFRYLGSVLHRSGRIDDDVAHRIRAECWPITKALANKVEVAELRMLRWTCGKTMVDMIPNGVFRAELDVDSIIDKMREGRLRWFGHVKRRPQTAPVRRVEALVVEGSRRRGRPKLRWEDRLKMDMKELSLSEDMTSDRNAWRDRIRISGFALRALRPLKENHNNDKLREQFTVTTVLMVKASIYRSCTALEKDIKKIKTSEDFEKVAGKIKKARELIKRVCEECLMYGDVWIEVCHLESPDEAKARIAKGVKVIPKSVKLWMQIEVSAEVSAGWLMG